MFVSDCKQHCAAQTGIAVHVSDCVQRCLQHNDVSMFISDCTKYFPVQTDIDVCVYFRVSVPCCPVNTVRSVCVYFRLYTASGQDLALFCIKEESFYATSAICPHASEFRMR